MQTVTWGSLRKGSCAWNLSSHLKLTARWTPPETFKDIQRTQGLILWDAVCASMDAVVFSQERSHQRGWRAQQGSPTNAWPQRHCVYTVCVCLKVSVSAQDALFYVEKIDLWMVYQLERGPIAALGLISMATNTQPVYLQTRAVWRAAAERLSLHHMCFSGRTAFNLSWRHQTGKSVLKRARTRVNLAKVKVLRTEVSIQHISFHQKNTRLQKPDAVEKWHDKTQRLYTKAPTIEWQYVWILPERRMSTKSTKKSTQNARLNCKNSKSCMEPVSHEHCSPQCLALHHICNVSKAKLACTAQRHMIILFSLDL